MNQPSPPELSSHTDAHSPEHNDNPCACTDDVETRAQHEVEEAREGIAHAREDMQHALHDLEKAEHDLEEAEAELKKAHDHRAVHFTVDGEPFTTDHAKTTPNKIIKDYGEKDPATHFLVKINKGHKESYEGRGNERIEICDGDRFQIVSTGPTPVSDDVHAGAEKFAAGLRALGYNPTALPGKPDHLVFDYVVEDGKCAGMKVRHGIVVPADFDLTPPSGPHVSPSIHPIGGPSGQHPDGNIGESDFQDAGGQWQYWSRPFNDWAESKRDVAAYMRHVWRLWATQ